MNKTFAALAAVTLGACSTIPSAGSITTSSSAQVVAITKRACR